ncbi:MAG: lysine--tRNA ligase [Halobacteriota archaeon]|nr:lysine--tRNA ligase [Halobacteriota archaeon]
MKESIHWADVTAKEILKKDIKHVVATGITPSGNIHIGNLREVVTADAVYRALLDAGADARLIYIADTYDPLRKVYSFLPESYERYVGHPISEIPDPKGDCHSNYAEHFLDPFLRSIRELGVDIDVFKADEMYKSGVYVEAIKTALEKRDEIAEIIDNVSGKTTPPGWSPFNPICKACGRINSAKVISYDLDEETVDYSCSCGDEGRVSMKGGGKLTWRVDWPARWEILGVTVEPFGKDHAVSGSSYDSGVILAEKIFNFPAPHPIPFEHIHLKGKGKMSSSSGVTITISEMLEVLPPEALRYLIIRTKPEKHIDLDPGLPSLNLMDEFDGLPFSDRSLELSQTESSKRFTAKVPFRHIVNAGQIADGDFDLLLEVLQRSGYDTSEDELIKLRSVKAERWLAKFAPDFVKFKVQKDLPDKAKNLSDIQKRALRDLADMLDDKDAEEIHNEIYRMAEELDIKPAKIFEAIYIALLGLKSGPRAGWFLVSLDRDFVKDRFRRVFEV